MNDTIRIDAEYKKKLDDAQKAIEMLLNICNEISPLDPNKDEWDEPAAPNKNEKQIDKKMEDAAKFKASYESAATKKEALPRKGSPQNVLSALSKLNLEDCRAAYIAKPLSLVIDCINRLENPHREDSDPPRTFKVINTISRNAEKALAVVYEKDFMARQPKLPIFDKTFIDLNEYASKLSDSSTKNVIQTAVDKIRMACLSEQYENVASSVQRIITDTLASLKPAARTSGASARPSRARP